MNMVWNSLASALALNLAICLAIAIGVQVLLWLYSEHSKDATIADIWWGTGFGCIALASFIGSRGYGDSTRNMVIVVLTVIWGARLSIYIRLRSRKQPEDRRYAAYRHEAAVAGQSVMRVMFRKVFGIQGLMMWITSIPIQVGQYLPPPVGNWFWIGVVVWMAGLAWESIADAQLSRFKRNPDNQGLPLTSGLWSLSRHPNYFGDALVWWGLFLLSCDHPAAWLTIFSPIRMTYRLGYRRSLKLLEENLLRNRPAYASYVRRTNRFWPWFPKRS